MGSIGDALTLQALFVYWVGGKLRGQNLDRYRPLKAHIPCTVHLAHPARA
jgi:hypothetical protein